MAQPDNSTVFLVSGGAKGITALCVKKLASRFECGFILLGRSQNKPEPKWAKDVYDDAKLKMQALNYLKATKESATPKKVQQLVKQANSGREIQATLNAVEEAGGTALYLSVDVTDREAMLDAVSKAESQIGKITGCIHGAGVLADKLIDQKSVEDIDKVIGVKVDGLRNMLEAVTLNQLEYLVLFSSVAAFYGNVGQTDYAAANEILNKVAHQVYFRHPQCRVIALDWGPWDGGMVTPTLKAMLAERNVEVIPVDRGTDILAEALTSDSLEQQVVVGGEMVRQTAELDQVLRKHQLRRKLTLRDNPFLHDHVIGGHAVLPTVCAVAWVVNACEQLFPGYTFYAVEDYRALKGIVFDESLADFFSLNLDEVHKSEEDGIVLDAVITSKTPEGKPRFHYKMQVMLKMEIPQPPIYPNVDLSEKQSKDGSILYQDNTLFHGPNFRGINRILNLSTDKLTMECIPPRVTLLDQGQFQIQTFNPFVTDIQLQSLLVWAKHKYGYGGLPLRIAKGVQYMKILQDEKTYASLEVVEATNRRLVADVIVHDTNGTIYSRVTGAEITLSERLNSLFQRNKIE